MEMNASSCRNKSALRGEVAGQLSSFSITCFLAKEGGEGSELKKHAVIMDEVDGMDGNADRGGVSVSGGVGGVGLVGIKWVWSGDVSICHRVILVMGIRALLQITMTLHYNPITAVSS